MHYEDFSSKHINDIQELFLKEITIGDSVDLQDHALFSSLGVYMTLLETHYGKVLIDEGRVKGFILAQVADQSLIIPKWKVYPAFVFQFIKTGLKWLVSSKTREARKIFLAFVQRCDELYKNLNYKSKVHLFVVSRELQGKGIGKNLMNEFQEYLKQHNISEFVLDTNTRCTYQFYDKNQFERIKESTLSYDRLNMGVFIYAKKI